MKIGKNSLSVIFVVSSLALVITSCHIDGRPRSSEIENFTIESGPDKIGWSEIWVIRHNQSGERFLFSERSSGGLFIVPISSQSLNE